MAAQPEFLRFLGWLLLMSGTAFSISFGLLMYFEQSAPNQEAHKVLHPIAYRRFVRRLRLWKLFRFLKILVPIGPAALATFIFMGLHPDMPWFMGLLILAFPIVWSAIIWKWAQSHCQLEQLYCGKW